ncbi:hypothetical protein ACLOJK_039642 [Asimina triloba]
MAKIEAAIVCLLVVVMDVVAGILGIEAEISQNKVKHLRFMVFECKEPSGQAFKLGLAAAGLLALAHVIANLLGGCICVCSKEEFATLAFGFGMLVIGAMSNNRSRAHCGISHHNFLSIGGILCFVHGLFCAAYYVSAAAAFGEEDKASHRHHGGA